MVSLYFCLSRRRMLYICRVVSSILHHLFLSILFSSSTSCRRLFVVVLPLRGVSISENYQGETASASAATVAERHPVRVLRSRARRALALLQPRAFIVLPAVRVPRIQKAAGPWHATARARIREGATRESNLGHCRAEQFVRHELALLPRIARESEVGTHIRTRLALVRNDPASARRRRCRRCGRRRSRARIQKALARRNVKHGVRTRHASRTENLEAKAIVLHLEHKGDGIAVRTAALERRVPRIAAKPHVCAARVRDTDRPALDECVR